LLIVGLGVGGARYFIRSRKPPARKPTRKLAPLVEVTRLAKREIQMIVKGYGTVSPTVRVELIPEVPGKVVYVHPQLKVGGVIGAGEKILGIDPRDYELAVEQAEAAVAEAEMRLETEKAEGEVARKEWEALHPGQEPDSMLVLRIPQIRRAEAALESARAQLATAKLRLERTTVSLPFDALILEERVDVGQYVVAGQALGVACGIESVEIEVPLEDGDLAWFDLADQRAVINTGKSGDYTMAEVWADFAGSRHSWQGRVVRIAGQVDRTSRMVPVVVEVAQPFDGSAGGVALLPGMFVEVLIQGRILKDVFAVPRDAIRQGNKVWVVEDGRLRIRTPEIVRADKDFAYVVSGLEDGVDVVLSSLDTVVDGMEVRTVAAGEAGGGGTSEGLSGGSGAIE